MKPSIFDRESVASLALNCGAAVALALAVNLAIFLFSPQSQTGTEDYPPGWLVGTVWTLLFAGLGAARWFIATSKSRQPGRTGAVAALVLFCAAYPFYTGLLTNLTVATLGNIATAVAAIVVAAFCVRSSRTAALLMVPVFCWVSFATFLTWRQGHLLR